MKKLRFIPTLIFLVLFLSITGRTLAADLPSGIINSLKTGNSKELSKYFNTNIDLTIKEKQDIYSKTQAEIILKEFFSKNVPTNFTVIHQGGKEGSQYVIGNLATSTGTFRITLALKSQDNTLLIQQLRIETGND